LKKSFAEIRNSIQESLTKRPMNIHEISRDTGINPKTVKKHLFYLEDIGIVRESEFNLRTGEMKLWELVR
jgi:predicted transcriptional regulator